MKIIGGWDNMKTKNQTTLASKYWLLILSLICIILMGLSLVTDK